MKKLNDYREEEKTRMATWKKVAIIVGILAMLYLAYVLYLNFDSCHEDEDINQTSQYENLDCITLPDGRKACKLGKIQVNSGDSITSDYELLE